MGDDKSQHDCVSQEDALSVKELFESVSWWGRRSNRHDLLRVATAISLMEIKLQSFKEVSIPSLGEGEGPAAKKDSSGVLCSGVTTAGLQMCGRLLKQAKEAFAMGDVDSGWMWVNELEREMLGAHSDEELEEKLISAEEEALEKLGKWRGSAGPKL